MTTALAMISGGLDSILAAKLVKDQGIEVIGICFKSHFFNEENALKIVKQIDIPLEVIDFSNEHFEMVRNPKHGYGKNVNPCIDCHAMMMRYSGELLERFHADFIITGEVLNQRPMSQNRSALDIVKNESGIGDKILRPLCAKNLNPTQMEIEGLIDRNALLDIKGRSRKTQMELAQMWGILEYPSPAGGCKLTEPNYSIRLKDLFEYKEDISKKDLELLKIGRHFKVSKDARIISTRTQEEGELLKQLLTQEDLVFLSADYNGSTVAIIGKETNEDIEFAAKIAGRYCKGKDEKNISISYGSYDQPLNKFIDITPATDEEINNYILK
ncbi:tRNA 4-thiouridine(8) synthase ThiI [Clostridium sp. CM028]|uniref:tRNA 4-thiouridine(8) synthase ThiI n=1 Tax=unclassified Clostridium TaxID=2614128 RepID=UPI001C0ACDD4|nr:MULTISPECIES: tRNA 4-thiouridine(8) synthase ThiI [unclassified Clostridium]MBU3092582.1 tRNA 4-thiouridine(8) synthase ThiI [Clostridium sp. CF011]MBW9146217.1 tRNA 4-thiouridine(8) synthase ThiI [Clostridium sp. CM027]MBW9149689.1 tRNA 4-thiouridine(8) synthase ThiI [Clostridium sp. CM028]UVE39804.1 tRNA 4-thiouridine(8) synthase ThiI [Clostridium sp. CM027]WAG68711.1 tRNA 4-thiouridine(8) synthase ThiI [Clostridium sp. CF011]